MADSAAEERNIGLIQVLTYGKKSMKKCRTEFKGNFQVLYCCDATDARRKTWGRYGLASDRNSRIVRISAWGTCTGVYFLNFIRMCHLMAQ
jgi:hypothetical protein